VWQNTPRLQGPLTGERRVKHLQEARSFNSNAASEGVLRASPHLRIRFSPGLTALVVPTAAAKSNVWMRCASSWRSSSVRLRISRLSDSCFREPLRPARLKEQRSLGLTDGVRFAAFAAKCTEGKCLYWTQAIRLKNEEAKRSGALRGPFRFIGQVK
jgi:hypothetical protein